MVKINEMINYIENVCNVDKVSRADFEKYLLNKPFSDARRGFYLMNIAQILKLMPQPPIGQSTFTG